MNLPRDIRTLDGREPHEDYGGWRRFLTERCEVRDEHEGVVYFGVTNCNYVVFPDGMLVENYGYHGEALMDRVRDEGVEAVQAAIRADRAEVEAALRKLRERG